MAVCGVISDEGADEMLRIIEEGCERIEPDTPADLSLTRESPPKLG